MSYDFEAFRVPAGMSAAQYVASGAYEESELDEAPATADERAEMERTAAALLAVDPAAERFDGEDHIELNLDKMQISLYARSAAISVPYWFEGAEAERVMARALEYARVLAETCGYTVWDPQAESVVESGSDAAAAGSIMSDISGRMDEIARPEKRPWWKIWG